MQIGQHSICGYPSIVIVGLLQLDDDFAGVVGYLIWAML
jgi:hypothetical protein